MFDGLRSPGDVPGPDGGRWPERETPERERSGAGAERRETEAPERKVAEDPEKELRRVRTRALVRHARAVDAIFEAQEMGGEASPEQVKELQKSRQVFEEVRPYGSPMPKPPTRRTRNLSARRLAAGSTAPSARSSSKTNSAPILAAAPIVSWSTGRSSTRPVCARIRRATSPATRPRVGDGRYGEKPRARSATGVHSRQSQAGARHRVRIRPPARPRIGLLDLGNLHLLLLESRTKHRPRGRADQIARCDQAPGTVFRRSRAAPELDSYQLSGRLDRRSHHPIPRKRRIQTALRRHTI